MRLDNLRYLAKTGTPEDLIGLLKAYGSKASDDGSSSCIDWIIAGVSEDGSGDSRNKKKTHIADFIGKRGAFKVGQDIPPDTAEQFRATIAELTEQVSKIPELTEQVRLLTEVVLEFAQTSSKEAPQKAAASKAAPKKATPTTSSRLMKPISTRPR